MAHFKDIAVKKTTSLNLVTGFFQYLRGKWDIGVSSRLTGYFRSVGASSSDLHVVCASLNVGETDA